MVQPDIIRSKAAKYGIDLNDPSGLGTLEETREELNLSHTRVIRCIDELEEVLLGVKNALEDIYSSSDRFIFTSLKHVNSMDGLVKNAEVAYSCMFAASLRRNDRDKAQAYFDISQSLSGCKDAIWLALQEILIS
jgi:hypothetical protein